jgi:transposase
MNLKGLAKQEVNQVLFLHDNARQHTSLCTREAIAKMGWTVLPYPPYSPDLASYEKAILQMMSRNAACAKSSKASAEFCATGKQCPMLRWKKCVDYGDFVQK